MDVGRLLNNEITDLFYGSSITVAQDDCDLECPRRFPNHVLLLCLLIGVN